MKNAILKKNYLTKNERSEHDLWERLANSIASVEERPEKWAPEFYEALKDWKVVMGGRIMANLGTESQATTFNCFVHHPRDINYYDMDSMDGIYDALKAQAKILSSGGGYGTNLSYIRPNGFFIDGIKNKTPGVLRFMELWDVSSKIVTMGSDRDIPGQKNEIKSIRKGAQLVALNVWHPDIIDFIEAKTIPGMYTKANLSVGITSGFMDAVINDENWNLEFPDTNYFKFESSWDGVLEKWKGYGYPVIVYKTIKARDLWEKIMLSTYSRNEPGVLFLDTINRLNPMSGKEIILASNPCGEIPMSTNVCLLGSINLVKFVTIEDGNINFNFSSFSDHVELAIRMLDNVNDMAIVPLPEYKEKLKTYRRVGLGIMGLGSTLMMLGLRYGSEESVKFVKELYKLKAESELLASAKLGKEKGSFLEFNKDHYFNTEWWKNLQISPVIRNVVESLGTMRNSHRSMNAPNGNTSIVAGVVSGGIEPVFEKEYIRWITITDYEKNKLRKEGIEFPDINKGEWFETKDFKFSIRGDEEILVGNINDNNYEIDKNRGITKANNMIDYGYKFIVENKFDSEIHDAVVTIDDLTVNDHLNILKVAAHYTDMSNSKTVNMPNNYSYEDFKDLYMEAWKSNIKGITTYRDGTMTAVLEKQLKVQSYQNELEKLFADANGKVILDGVKLPKEYYEKGFIIRDRNKKKWYVHIAFADSKYKRPFALFVSTNSKESSEVANEVIEAMKTLLRKKKIKEHLIERMEEKISGQTNITKIARVIGMALRHNIKIIDIVNTLEQFDIEFSSFIFHLKKLLQKFISDGESVKGEKCPSCGSKSIIYSEGCKMCKECNWSAC